MDLTNTNYNKKYLKYKAKYIELLKNMRGGSSYNLNDISGFSNSDKISGEISNKIEEIFLKLDIPDKFLAIENEIINKIKRIFSKINSEQNDILTNIINNFQNALDELLVVDEKIRDFYIKYSKYFNQSIWDNTMEQMAELQVLVLLKRIESIINSPNTIEEKCKEVTTALLLAINQKTNTINNILTNTLNESNNEGTEVSVISRNSSQNSSQNSLSSTESSIQPIKKTQSFNPPKSDPSIFTNPKNNSLFGLKF